MARSKNDMLQSTYLNDLRKQRMSVLVYLMNGVKQAGMIESFDQHALLLRHGGSLQLIYKHTIASIMPAAKAFPAMATPPVKQPVKRSTREAVPVITRKVSRRTIVREE